MCMLGPSHQAKTSHGNISFSTEKIWANMQREKSEKACKLDVIPAQLAQPTRLPAY